MSAHTPGPWKVIHHPEPRALKSSVSVGSGSNGMGSISWMTSGGVGIEANARLIAAAPDLLAALVEIENQVSSAEVEPEQVLGNIGRIARAAIAKAVKP